MEPRRADPSPPPPCSSEGRKSPEPGVCAVQECNAADVDKALNDTQFRAVLTESAFLWVESQHAVRWLLLLLLFSMRKSSLHAPQSCCVAHGVHTHASAGDAVARGAPALHAAEGGAR